MPLFLSIAEKAAITRKHRDARLNDFYWALQRRVDRRVSKPGLLAGDETADWWRPVCEYLTDVAMAHALMPTTLTAAWLRDVTLSLARRPQDDWVGPHYRDHRVLDDGMQIGQLETAHICWAVAIVLDLAADVFTDTERDEVAHTLQQRGIPMCVQWLDRPHPAANWWCVLTAGLTVAAAVLDDRASLQKARVELSGCTDVFQRDGSYCESLQYGNYALYALMLAGEAVRRRGEDVNALMPLGRLIGYARWAVASYLYSRPTSGWGSGPRPRSLNFNDSGAVFRPTADVLLHLSARGRESYPTEAGLARWLFEETYASYLTQGPHDQASFGLRTSWGFLTLPLLTLAADPLSPDAAGLDTALAFDCGDSIARDAWTGRTVLALRGGGEPMHGPGHLHHDLNSIIVAHNHERLLTDAGHSCYRNTLRKLDLSTDMHSTCTFQIAPSLDDACERWTSGQVIQQQEPPRRNHRASGTEAPVDRGARRLITAALHHVRVLGSETAAAYGQPIARFARFTILCGPHVLFVVDHIRTDSPVFTQWNWLLNNRDGELDLKLAGPDRVVARRGNAGMKLFSLSGGAVQQFWAHAHDAYHCMPGQMGEGRPGSAVLLRWTDPKPRQERLAVHAIALDTPGAIAGWHLKQSEQQVGLESPSGAEGWSIQAEEHQIMITEQASDQRYCLALAGDDRWALKAGGAV
jgi:hypothetical protein